MFTTLTLDAQELSMASIGVNPPRLAPYPTEVGTANTGQGTSPPTTLGSAPSMPAIATTAQERWSIDTCGSSRCNPATPTSLRRKQGVAIACKVAEASSATGRSEVPAQTTVTCVLDSFIGFRVSGLGLMVSVLPISF